MKINRIEFSHKLLAGLLLLLPLSSCSKESDREEIMRGIPTEETPPQLRTVDIKSITTTAALVIGEIVDSGSVSITERGACFSTSGIPTINATAVKSSKVSGSGTFEVELRGLENNTDYRLRAYAITQQGTVFYGKEMTFKTVAANLPKTKTFLRTVAGAHEAFIDAELLEEGGTEVTEKGVVWSQDQAPTIKDFKIISTEQKYKFKSRLGGLAPNTRYYARSYAINSEGVGYGEQVEVHTIPKGNVTFYLHKEDNPGPELQEIYKRLDEAFDTATGYYDNFTSIVKHLNVHYNPGVSTADGNINGTIRVGPILRIKRPALPCMKLCTRWALASTGAGRNLFQVVPGMVPEQMKSFK